ncbi:MAG: ABC transporter permease [Thermoflexaceae bacterium]|nr:ABC transporter permease [Thermoflexaceae bacterium]
MSTYQELFLKKRRRYRHFILFFQFFLLVFFILLWEIAARHGWINDFIFSSPERMFSAFIKMARTGEIFRHTLITLLETFVSFLFVIGCGLITAILMWSFKSLSDILEPYIVTLNSLPKSALAPVLIVWLGTGYKTIIVTAVSVSVFGTILSLYTSFAETSPEKIKLITTLGGSRKDILTKLILPGSIPVIISCMKVNIGLCLVGVIIAEFLVANAGLGYVIIYNSQIFKMDLVLLSICLLCIMAALLYKLINMIEKKLS